MGPSPSSLLGYGVATGNYAPFTSGGKTAAPYGQAHVAGYNTSQVPIAAPVTYGGGGNDYQSQIDAAKAQIKAYQQYSAQLAAQVNALPKLLPYDYNAANAKARANAEGAVNPLYTKMFTDYLNQAKVQQQRQQEDTTTANTLLQQNLQNTLTGNAVTGQRTSQDVANNVGQINQQAQNFQQDTGTAFDQARTNQAVGLAQSGLTGSGLGAQQQVLTQNNRNIQEQRQGQAFDVQKQAQELFKTRTFEDLARSGALATQAEGQGEKQNAVNLARYIQDYGDTTGQFTAGSTGLGYNVKQQQQSLEQQRLAALSSEQQRQNSLLFNNYVATLAPNQATNATYTRQALGL